MGLSEIDRNLLERCLQKKPRAWEDFVDRFMGLVLHVIRHTAQARSIRVNPSDRDDLCAEVFLAIIKNDFSLLRNFRGQSSLATYLTVVARRIVVHELFSRGSSTRLNTAIEKNNIEKHNSEKGEDSPSSVPSNGHSAVHQGAVHQTVTTQHLAERIADPHTPIEQRIADQDQVERLLDGLPSGEAMVVRMFHLEGKTYQEISQTLGLQENSIGPILSRARDKMRRASVNTAAS